jgi:hypothetical protein
LADFETPFEIERLSGGARFSIDHEIAIHGESSLKVLLTTEKYSGVGLKHFPRDWRGFDSLRFSLFNSSTGPFKIVCRVHDSFHYGEGGMYDDRFNMRFMLIQGWNNIIIPLENIAKAPTNRKMDLSHIQVFGIHVVRLPKPEIIYIDYIRLMK